MRAEGHRPKDGPGWASLLLLLAAMLVAATLGWGIEMIPD
jgi:hypothetical protein